MVDTAAALANNITEQERDKAEASPPALVLVSHKLDIILIMKSVYSVLTITKKNDTFLRTKKCR